MDVEKLIRRLRNDADAYRNGETLGRAFADQEDVLDNAATALSTLQDENKRLNKIVCSIPTTPDSGRTVSQYDKEMSMCAYLDDLEAENEKLRAELEKVMRERDAAIKELDEVTSEVDDLADFVDREIHPVIDYNLYLDLRENVDAVSMFQHEDEWRGLHKEE